MEPQMNTDPCLSVILSRKSFAGRKGLFFAKSSRSSRLRGESWAGLSPRRREAREENAKDFSLVRLCCPVTLCLCGEKGTMKEPVVISWSGGKDSAMALYEVQRSGAYDVLALLTTVTADYDRVSMDGVRRELVQRQAQSLGVSLEPILIANDACNDE